MVLNQMARLLRLNPLPDSFPGSAWECLMRGASWFYGRHRPELRYKAAALERETKNLYLTGISARACHSVLNQKLGLDFVLISMLAFVYSQSFIS